MAIEEEGRRPEALAAAVHDQLGPTEGRVDVHRIAMALDIIEIVSEPLDTIEGALITQPERTNGVILTNARSPARRQRYTVAHELLHFLNDSHVQTPEGFRCRLDDLKRPFDPLRHSMTRHRRQEAEANRFAIELMAPRNRVEPLLSDEPDLGDVLTLAKDLDLSKEATARRVVELHPADVAVVFSHRGRVRYWASSQCFPQLMLRTGHPMPMLSKPRRGRLSAWEDADPTDWLQGSDAAKLRHQTLHQADNRAITLLHAVSCEPADDVEDLYDRILRQRG